MRVLIVSSNSLPAAPSGPAYVAGAVRQAGHTVEIFESLHAADLQQALADRLQAFQPDVVGLSIRLVHGDVQDPAAPFGTRYLDLRPRVREIAALIRQNSPAPIVLGGPGFGYYARDWLETLDLDCGICGEGEVAFPLLLERLAGGGEPADVPGCITRRAGGFRVVPPQRVEDLDSQALPAYDLVDWERCAAHQVLPAIFTKRGCAFDCTFCPYGKLEGQRYRLKSPERVLAEVEHSLQHTPARKLMFCDNSFNVPRSHAVLLCRAFIDRGVDFQWGTGDLKPIGVTDEFCRLMRDSGCFYANLSVESASEAMLRRMKRGYSATQVRESLEALSRSGLPFGASLMFGAPGETPDTIAETLRLMADYEIPLGVWVTLGVYLWTEHQAIVPELRQSGWLPADRSLFDGPVHFSPALPAADFQALVAELRARPGYTVQVNRADLRSGAPVNR
ncbi:MAG TPA: radical SAM protein [Anaerolineaceae bacterium]|nr:radical SAM protein [Anaerolineaceae bacterium]